MDVRSLGCIFWNISVSQIFLKHTARLVSLIPGSKIQIKWEQHYIIFLSCKSLVDIVIASCLNQSGLTTVLLPYVACVQNVEVIHVHKEFSGWCHFSSSLADWFWFCFNQDIHAWLMWTELHWLVEAHRVVHRWQ